MKLFFFFFCYSKNKYTEGDDGVPHNFMVVCTHFCFTAQCVFESGGWLWGLWWTHPLVWLRGPWSLGGRGKLLRVTGLVEGRVGSASWSMYLRALFAKVPFASLKLFFREACRFFFFIPRCTVFSVSRFIFA